MKAALAEGETNEQEIQQEVEALDIKADEKSAEADILQEKEDDVIF